jgi:putative transcriptional regulator
MAGDTTGPGQVALAGGGDNGPTPFYLWLREERERRGWTQGELVRRLGKPQSMVSAWESGDYVPTLKNAIAIAEVFGVAVDTVIQHIRNQGTKRPDSGTRTARSGQPKAQTRNRVDPQQATPVRSHPSGHRRRRGGRTDDLWRLWQRLMALSSYVNEDSPEWQQLLSDMEAVLRLGEIRSGVVHASEPQDAPLEPTPTPPRPSAPAAPEPNRTPPEPAPRRPRSDRSRSA